jgi:glycerate kinase
MARRLLAAPDKLRGTLTAREAAAAIASGAARAGWSAGELPLADGGEGTLEALGGGNRTSRVTGPLGMPVDAAWRLEDGVAVIEAAGACGLSLAGGRERNEPLRATTRGVGELVAAALEAGAERIVVAVGGVATTDGGLGALDVLRPLAPLALEVACDVEARFVDAVETYAPQKGASPQQTLVLRTRLEELAARYRDELGVDVAELPGSGAAGGLAGGLAALGASLVPGFELVAERVRLDRRLAESDLVVTGEGLLDATSFTGKVVGGVLARAARAGVPALVVAGELAGSVPPPAQAFSLVERCGRERALAEAAACLEAVVAEALARR